MTTEQSNQDEDLDEGDLDDDEDIGNEGHDDDNDLGHDEEKAGATLVERLSSVDGWEMYRLSGEDTALVVVSVAIRPVESADRAMEYAIWRPSDLEEPGATGSAARAAGEWDDAGRAVAIRQVLDRHPEDLCVDPEKMRFLFPEPEDEHPEGEG